MALYNNSKRLTGAQSPSNAVDAAWQRTEPLIDAKGVRERVLWGVKLVSTQTGKEMPDDIIDGQIQDSIAELEEEMKFQFFPTQHFERYAFDRHEYQCMGYFTLRQRPVRSVEKLSIITSNDQEIWTVSNDWIDAGYLNWGRIYIVPINVAAAPSSSSGGAAGGAAFLAIIGQQPWVPAYWKIQYTTGFEDGAIPRQINILIGYRTALNILRQLATANARANSKSVGIDGFSQSSSNAGPGIYAPIMEDLQKKEKALMQAVKSRFGGRIKMSNV